MNTRDMRLTLYARGPWSNVEISVSNQVRNSGDGLY